MPFRWSWKEHTAALIYLSRWALIAVPMGMLVGCAVALFLWLLDLATRARWTTDGANGIPWLLYLLPVAGMLIGLLYHWIGKPVEGGNNLIIEQIQEPGAGVPARMTPLVLIGTVLTHLFGGSAGREGTAVQMGGSIASNFGRYLGLSQTQTRTLLMAGVAAGFGAVFGTPLTGAVFAVEMLTIGRADFHAILPCLFASVAGDWTTRALHITHTAYTIVLPDAQHLHPHANIDWLLMGKVAIAAVGFGLASVVFSELTHGLHGLFKKLIPFAPLRPALGGAIIIALAWLVAPDYLGLGVTAPAAHPHQVSIISCFSPGGATYWSWWWKILFTAVTLSSGFKGGEVTPLFFIGAAMGNAAARLLHAPIDLFAGIGFVAVFAGATNTPLACTLMAIELFGSGLPDAHFVLYVASACFIAFLVSGHSGIYLSQRIANPQFLGVDLPEDASLRVARERRSSVRK